MCCLSLSKLILIHILFLQSISLSSSNLLQLCYQVDYYKKLGTLSCLKFADYGCWCGPGGFGKAVDGVDECCMNHDHCYDTAKEKYSFCFPYISYYRYKDGTCVDETGTCAWFVCKCDYDLAKCLSTREYHEKNTAYRLSGGKCNSFR